MYPVNLVDFFFFFFWIRFIPPSMAFVFLPLCRRLPFLVVISHCHPVIFAHACVETMSCRVHDEVETLGCWQRTLRFISRPCFLLAVIGPSIQMPYDYVLTPVITESNSS
jgi:hypothetical protein